MQPSMPGIPQVPPAPWASPMSALGSSADGSVGVPMPCGNCGAPMQLVTGPHLHSNLGLACGYCHRTEPLPADAAERVRYLQFRLLQLSQARQADEAPLRVVGTLRRAWLPAFAVLSVTVGVTVVQTVSTLQALKQSAPAEAHSYGMSMAVSLAVFFGYLSGYLGMSRGYRRSVQPLLRARPPRAAGLSIRCRSCGGDLPKVNAPEIVCQYCGATNLLDGALSAHASELLQAEIAAYQARANHVYSTEAFREPTKAFYRWGAAGATVGVVMGLVAISVILAAL